jgi:hypothetical protein
MKKKQSNFMKMQKLLLIVFGLLCVIFGTIAPAKAQINQTILDQIKTMTFQHQGMTNKMSDLNFIKQQINNGVEPWASNYHKMATSGSASLTYTPNAMDYPTNTNGGENREMNDAMAAKTQALMWIFTGNTAYAENVRKILNAWSTTLVDQQGLNWMLDAAWAAYMFADAAELVRNSYSGWTITDTENFTKMANDIWLPILNRRFGFGNRELAVSTALCAIGVFNNDRAAFYKGILYWMDYIPSYIYMTSDGASPLVADYWTHELTNDQYAAMDADISGTSGTNWWTYSTMMVTNPTRSIGLNTKPSGSQSSQKGYWVASKFSADANIPVNTMSIYQMSGNGGHARLGIYSDNSGTPGTLLAQTGQITFAAYNGIYSAALGSTVNLTSGSSYWLVYEVDAAATTLSYSNTGTSCYATSDFGLLPSTAPTGLTTSQTGTGVYYIYANYGGPFGDDKTAVLKQYNTGNVVPVWSGMSGTAGGWIQGSCAETLRDLQHVENSICHIFNTAEIALNQGIDLYSICPERLAAFVEMNAFLRLGNPCPGGYTVKGSGFGLMSTYEVAYNHLANVMKMSLPYTQKLIYPTLRKCTKSTITPAPAGILANGLGCQIGWFTVCETLTFGELNKGGDISNLKCVSSGTPSSTYTYQVVNSDASVTSKASLWIKGTGQVSLQIKSDNLGTLLASIDINATSTWTKYTTADFNSGTSGKLTFELVDLGTTAGTVYIDNCFIGPTGIDAANLLANPSFESGLSPWTSTSSTVWKWLDEASTIIDTILPVVLTRDITVQLDANGQASITTAEIDNGSTDASGIASMLVSKTAFNCSNVGANTVTLTVTDVNGNSSTADAVVTVQDSIVPVAIAQNITIELDATGQASITPAQINNGSTDVCGIASLAVSQTAFDCSNVGTNTVVLTVTDVNGNSSTADAVVTVQDKIVPVAIAQNISVTLQNGSAIITASSIDNGSYDACGIQSMVIDQSEFDCSNIGNNTITLSVTDMNGSVSSTTAIVTVIGDKPVASIAVSRTDNTFTGLESNIIALGYGAQLLTLTASNSSSANNITSYLWSPSTGLDNATITDPVFTPTIAGDYTFFVTATNEYGCSASTSINITVIDVRCGNKNDKVLVCHKTGSNSNQWNQICISTNAVSTHLSHGDKLGSCASSETDTLNMTKSASIIQEAVSKNSSITTQEATLAVYPNPFSSTTNLEFRIANSGFVNLKVFDIFGREVATLVNEVKSPGTFTVQWNAENLDSGTYLARIITGEQTKTIMILLEK